MTADRGEDPARAEASQPSLGRQVALGSAFMVGGRMAVRLIGVVSTLILARLLLPEDFGLIGLAAAAIAIAEVLTTTSVGMAVVRRPVVDRAIYDSAWTINLLRCLLLAGLLAATAEWQAGLLGDPRIGPIILVVAATIALDGLASAGIYRLQRELRFDAIFRYELVGKLCAFVITIALALWLQNYWCLVLGNLLSRFIAIPYGYLIAPHRPRISFAAGWELLHFSKWMLASNACGAIEGQAANLAIGRLVGLPALGLWQLSWQVAAVPVTELAVPIRAPIYAGYARVQHDRALLRQHFLAGFGLVAAVLTPLSIGVALVAPEIERVALGTAFAGAAALIVLCALYAYIDALAHFTFNLFIVVEQQRRMVLVHLGLVLVRVPAVIAGAMFWGAEGAGIALVATAVMGAFAWHGQLGRLLGHGPRDVLAVVWRSFAAAGVMAAGVLALRAGLAPHQGSLGVAFLNLLLLSAAGAVLHVGTQALLWRLAGAPDGAERRLLDLAGRAFAALRARLARGG
jgi:O-antigen/teichoic acid export membrane protein